MSLADMLLEKPDLIDRRFGEPGETAPVRRAKTFTPPPTASTSMDMTRASLDGILARVGALEAASRREAADVLKLAAEATVMANALSARLRALERDLPAASSPLVERQMPRPAQRRSARRALIWSMALLITSCLGVAGAWLAMTTRNARSPPAAAQSAPIHSAPSTPASATAAHQAPDKANASNPESDGPHTPSVDGRPKGFELYSPYSSGDSGQPVPPAR